MDFAKMAAVRHAELTAQHEQLREEMTRLQHKIDEVSSERERVALAFCGAKIGDTVRLTGARYKGSLAKIEDAVIWNPGCAPAKLGKKPTILVSIPSSRSRCWIKISGHLWDLVDEQD